MAAQVEALVLGLSVLVHAGVGWAMVRVEPQEASAPPPTPITIRVVEPEVREEPPELEPEPAHEPDVADTVEPEAVEPKPEPMDRPKPEPAHDPAPPTAPAGPPDFGLELGGGSGPGIGVAQGDPAGVPGGGGGGGKKVVTRKQKLVPTAAAKSTCSEIVKPKPLKLTKPSYTEAARAAKIEGAVRLRLEVAADGSVGAVEVLQSLDPELDARAIAAAKAATFDPGRACGKPVAASVTLSMRFTS